MKTKDIENKIETLNKKLNENRNRYINPLIEKKNNLSKERILSIIENKEYIFDLSEYNEKEIFSIVALRSDGKEEDLPLCEIVHIENGKLFCSDYNSGIVKWSDEDNCYVKLYHGSEKKLDIIGFIDIETC
jgi:hypothetical protein